MKKSTLISCLAFLLFSGCAGLGGRGGELVVNESLPRVEGIKTISAMSSIAFEWKFLGDENIEGFYIYRAGGEDEGLFGVLGASADGAKRSQSGYALIATVKNKFSTHYVDTGLEPARLYHYIFKTFNSQGQVSKDSKNIEVSTAKILEKPPFIQAITKLPGRIKLIWRPHPDPRVSGYIIQRREAGGGDFRELARVDNRLSAEYIDEDMRPDESFSYRILALSFDGVKSPPSTVVSGTSKALPPQVSNLRASSEHSNKIVLDWEAPEFADLAYFKIYSAAAPLLPYTLLAKTAKPHYEQRISGAGTSRYYRVSVVDKDGLESERSEGVRGQTLPLPAAPSIISVRIEPGGIRVEWRDNDERAASYTVRRYGGEAMAIFKEVREKRLRDIKALPGVEYSYEVIAIDENGQESAPSARVRAAQ